RRREYSEPLRILQSESSSDTRTNNVPKSEARQPAQLPVRPPAAESFAQKRTLPWHHSPRVALKQWPGCSKAMTGLDANGSCMGRKKSAAEPTVHSARLRRWPVGFSKG